ncbi:Ig domain-containing protein [Clostridium sp. HBUAS56017]|uniref:Ig-like domain-containing protein n=1 Tax=Clostridium sp. HBUAS56017 TaxID=2571128 RepID=UPI001177DAE5|nr:Ig domain-containing protein [Clostridium sp. HBUAS56017]
MKKIFKVIGVFLSILIIAGVIFGTNDMKKVSASTAKVGQALLQPETGWKRVPCTDPAFTYVGFNLVWQPEAYVQKILDTRKEDSTIKFNFTGTKFRLILFTNYDKCKENIIKINGVEYKFSDYTSGYVKCNLAFEKLDCNQGVNTVEVISKGYVSVDSIDIDADGSINTYGNKSVTGISLDKTSLDMNIGDTSNLIATVAPDDATNKTLKWTSSDPSIATVDENGKITAIKEGAVTITVAAQDGSDKVATCIVNIKNSGYGSGLLTVTMTNGQQRTYNLSKSQIDDFIKWYKNRANGQGEFIYAFDKEPSSGAYTKRTEYLIFDKISNFDVDEYSTRN